MTKMSMKYTDAEKAALLRSKDFDTRLQAIKALSAKALIAYALKEFAAALPLGNGRTWLLRKVSYLELERCSSGLAGRAAERAEKLNTPMGVKECKQEDESMASSAVKTIMKDTVVKAPKESAARMFQALIIAHKLTDDQIFKAVQKKFNLPDSRRSYVAWYRNYLKKTGTDVKAVAGGKK